MEEKICEIASVKVDFDPRECRVTTCLNDVCELYLATSGQWKVYRIYPGVFIGLALNQVVAVSDVVKIAVESVVTATRVRRTAKLSCYLTSMASLALLQIAGETRHRLLLRLVAEGRLDEFFAHVKSSDLISDDPPLLDVLDSARWVALESRPGKDEQVCKLAKESLEDINALYPLADALEEIGSSTDASLVRKLLKALLDTSRRF